jgi:hypothetical protein
MCVALGTRMWNPYSKKTPLCRIPAPDEARPILHSAFIILHSAFSIALCAPPDRPFRGPRTRFCPSPLARPGGPRFVAAARKARP